MSDPIAVTSAWSVLQSAWVWRWFFIVVIGASPLMWCKLTGRDIQAHPWSSAHRVFSLIALLLTLWSIRLFIDTWQLDAQDPNALVESTCVVAMVPEHRFDRMVCEDGKRYWIEVEPETSLEVGKQLRLTRLPVTDTVVRLREVK